MTNDIQNPTLIPEQSPEQIQERFTGRFTQQEPIPQEGIDAALAVLQNGRLHRYNTVAGEVAQAALLEQEFAALVGAKYCVAVASGGYALGCALRALQLAPGERVLTNAFTLAPVPGAIAACGGQAVFVDATPDLTLDLDHLEQMAKMSGARIVMLSHMRGHVCDMEALLDICQRHGLVLVEDCAHTMGASWKGVASGRHGAIGCYSMQTYKHINAGEGGFLVSDDPELIARAILLSGSYMLYSSHLAAPGPEVFARIRLDVPNVSGRMDNLRAAILRPQLKVLPQRVARWGELYRCIEAGLAQTPGVHLTARAADEVFVGSSFQFMLPGWSAARIGVFLARTLARGVELKWFGADQPIAFTSRYDHWQYAEPCALPKTDQILAGLLDMRVPLTFSPQDCQLIARILREEILRVGQGPEPDPVVVPAIQ